MANICRWQVRAKTEEELIALVAEHVREVHQLRGVWPGGAQSEDEARASIVRHVRRAHFPQISTARLLGRSAAG